MSHDVTLKSEVLWPLSAALFWLHTATSFPGAGSLRRSAKARNLRHWLEAQGNAAIVEVVTLKLLAAMLPISACVAFILHHSALNLCKNLDLAYKELLAQIKPWMLASGLQHK